jgi:hypothetical protein
MSVMFELESHATKRPVSVFTARIYRPTKRKN